MPNDKSTENDLPPGSSFYDNLPHPYILLNITGEVLSANTALVDLLGHDQETVEHNSFFKFVSTDSVDTVEALFTTLKTETKASEIRIELRQAKGSRIPVVLDAQVEVNDGVRLIHGQFTKETTPEKQREMKQKIRAMEKAPIGFTMSDPKQEDNPLIYANEGFERMTGYSIEEAIGENCRYLQGENTGSEPVSKMQESIENEEDVTVELANYRKDGTPFWNRVKITPMYNVAGELTHFVAFQEDITERKRFERRLTEQRDNLAVLNQVVRHDIRNNLQALDGFSEMLAEKFEPGTDGHQCVEQIIESTADAIELTTIAGDMADAMLMDESSLEKTCLKTTIEDEINSLTSTYPNARISVNGELPSENVLANKLLNSVFRNILKNAVLHNDKDIPEITISATNNRVNTVKIADNGPGVPDDQKDVIFGRGEKGLDSSGTGLGLYLVETLLDLYDGSVRIEDNEPEGSVFIVELPLIN